MKLIDLLKICDKQTYVRVIDNTKNINRLLEYGSVGRLLDTKPKYLRHKVLEVSTWANELWIDVEG